jgi:hypothetical protein
MKKRQNLVYQEIFDFFFSPQILLNDIEAYLILNFIYIKNRFCNL